MNQASIRQVTNQLETLSDEQLNPVLEFIQSLKQSKRHGIPGNKLMKFAGAIPSEDAEQMLQTIEQDCRKVDINEW